MITPQVVHVCNHIIEKQEIVSDAITAVRSEASTTDQLMVGVAIRHVQSVFQENTFYFEGADWRMAGANSLQWLPGGNQPLSGTEYSVECLYARNTLEEWDDEVCPRCETNGWYVDILPGEKTEITHLRGISKIVQDIIKMIFTYRVEGNYGTRITDYVGAPMNKPEQVMSEVAAIVAGAATRYRQIQADALARGIKLPGDDLLDRLVIHSVQHDKEGGGILIDATVYNQSGDNRPFRLGA